MKRFRSIMLLLFCVISLVGCGSDQRAQEEEQELTIGDLSKETYTLEVGDRELLSVSISPKETDLEDLNIQVSDLTVIAISNPRIDSGWFSTTLYFDVTAISEGTATIHIESADGTVSSTNTSTIFVEKPEKVQSFGEFVFSERNLYVGDSQEVSWPIRPKNLSREDVILNVTNDSVVSINEISFENDEKSTLFKFEVTGISEGQCEISIQSATGKIISEPLIFIVEVAPVIRSFGKFTQETFHMETGDTYTFTWHILPSGVSRENFTIEISDNSTISIAEDYLEDRDDHTEFKYTVKAVAPGESTVTLVSSDGKTTSQTFTFIVTEKDTSRTVYVTPTGEKYHFSAACAGENANPITLNQAKARGYDPCRKCAS